jgi:predicted MPP superfamily phosphohydrolase
MFFSACDKFEYSPYNDNRNGLVESNLNRKNIEKLLVNEKTADDTVTIVYSGDTQRFYKGLHDLVNKVNTMSDVDLFVVCGDISDFGLVQEFDWVVRELKRLKIPFVCVIGNHDLAAGSSAIYTSVFGPVNESFTYKGYKFIMHDTNGREYDFRSDVPDIPWLTSQLNDTSASWFVGLSHVPPFDLDFNPALEEPYKNLFSSQPSFITSLHGHRHNTSDSYYYEDHVRYLTSNSAEKSEFLLLKFVNGQMSKSIVPVE